MMCKTFSLSRLFITRHSHIKNEIAEALVIDASFWKLMWI